MIMMFPREGLNYHGKLPMAYHRASRNPSQMRKELEIVFIGHKNVFYLAVVK